MNFRKSNAVMRLMGFVPALVVQYLLQKQKIDRHLPEKQSFKSVVMFADISGFTNLTETLSKIGKLNQIGYFQNLGHEGSEMTAFAINRYMELLVSAINKSGGDIFKFAGDAMIVVWPPSENNNDVDQHEELRMTCRQAIQSSLDIQSKLDNTNILENIKLSVKIGQCIKFYYYEYKRFGIGDISIIYVGGVFGRSEYLATGDTLTQAFMSEHHCTSGGQTIVSQQVYDMVKEFFYFEQVQEEGKESNFYQLLRYDKKKIKMKADALLIKNKITLFQFESIKQQILMYIPQALIPYIKIDQETWSSELRRISVIFINLGIDLSDAKSTEGLNRIQKVIETVQKCVYMHEGSLNKLLMDDKGSTLIVCFGLPPLMHQDDPIRAILASFMLKEQLGYINCKCSIGISTGTVFTGVVGTSGSRREYSVLGDSVNLAARLMQTAIKDNNILCCERTAKESQRQIICEHWKNIPLKGKSGLVPVYKPVNTPAMDIQQAINSYGQFYLLRTHFQYLPANEVEEIDRRTLSEIKADMIGRKQEFQKVKEILTKMIYTKFNKKKEIPFIHIKGEYGIGKSYFIKKVFEDLVKETKNRLYKYDEKVQIFVSYLNPIWQTFKLNGVCWIIREMFYRLAQRRQQKLTTEFLQEILGKNVDEEEQFTHFEMMVGLKQFDAFNKFPPKPSIEDQNFIHMEKKTFGDMAKRLFAAYLEQKIKVKRKSKNKLINIKTVLLQQSLEQTQVDEEKDESKSNSRSQSQSSASSQKSDDDEKVEEDEEQMKQSVSPVIFCLEDIQYFDSYSWYIIKVLMKNFGRVGVVGLYRDNAWAIPYSAKKEDPKPNDKKKQNQDSKMKQEEVYENGLDQIEKIEKVQLYQFELKRMNMSKDNNEMNQLILAYFNIQQFVQEEEKQSQNEQTRSRKITTKNVFSQSQLQDCQQQFKDPLLFWESKQQLLQLDFNKLVLNYLYLKTSGHPLICLCLIHNLITQKFINIDTNAKIAFVSLEMQEILNHEDWLCVEVPLASMQINASVLDGLGSEMSLLLKFSSVIGDIFDIQTLYKIMPFKDQINQEKLLAIMNQLCNKGIIEFMDGNSDNQFYRFINPFIREAIYQRMTYLQRRSIHRSVAEAFQVIPQPKDYDERKDQRKLEFHWRQAETKGTSEGKVKIIFSNKAKRSIIVKEIQMILAKNNYNLHVSLRSGYLEKRSEKGVYWLYRYCVIDSQDFKMYESEDACNNGKDPSGILPLKQISSIEALSEQGNKKQKQRQYILIITVANWVKRSLERDSRSFIFSCENEDDLEEWSIFLEFAKAKAIYTDFVENFGKISFPINLTLDAFDTQLTMELTQQMRRVKIGISKPTEQLIQNSRQMGRLSRLSKMAIPTMEVSFNSPRNPKNHKSSILLTKKTIGNRGEEKIEKFDVQAMLKDFLYKSMLVLWIHLITKYDEKDIQILGETGKFMTQNVRFFDCPSLKALENQQLQQQQQSDK